MGRERKQLCCIEQRQFKLLGHLTHKRGLEDLALRGRIPGNSAGGTQRFTFIKNFKLFTKILKNYGRLPVAEQIGETSQYIEGWISLDKEREVR